MRKIFIIISIAVILLAGCGESPMKKLASDKLSSGMTTEFWQKEHDKNTDLWQKGFAYCRKYQGPVVNTKPNCEPLIKVYTYAILQDEMKKAFADRESKKLFSSENKAKAGKKKF